MYHVPLVVQCIYGCNDGGEDGDGKEGSEITWPLVCRSLGSM